MQGLELLYSRLNEDNISFEEEERKFNITVPELFLQFLNLYDVSRIRYERVLWEKNNHKYPFRGQVYTGYLNSDGKDKYVFEEFLSPNEIFSRYYEDYHDDEIGTCSRKYILFGVSGLYNATGGFLVGTVGDETEKIIVDTEDFGSEDRFIVIEDNIFEFAKKFEMRDINLDYIHKGISNESFYKNWGEDFWRVGVNEFEL